MFRRLLVLILCTFNIQQNHRCRLNSRADFSQPLPIILRNGQLLEPTDKYGNVEFNQGDTLVLSCEGSGHLYHPNAQRVEVTVSVTCEYENKFRSDQWLDSISDFSLFRCNFPPNYHSKRTDRSCFEGNPIIEVGYTVQNNFYPVFESCFNEGGLRVVYSKYTQKPYNANYQTKVERPFFISNDNYGLVPVDTLFSPRGQKSAVAQLVGNMIDQYVTKNEFLSRGHLAAKTDFVFAFGERATFHYVNCAPQWTGFNGGNWNTLEVDLRNHIHASDYNTVIYTGTFGVTQLFNQFGRKVEIYLYTDENNNPVIPVPKYFYKVVFEPSTKRGIAFVGINNPYYTESEARDLFFCQDLCRGNYNFSWLSWNPDNAMEGYTFCCSVPDFRRTVEHLPAFEVNSLLT